MTRNRQKWGFRTIGVQFFKISGLRLGWAILTRKWSQKPSKMHPKLVPKSYQKWILLCVAKRKPFLSQHWPTWPKNGTPRGAQKLTESNFKGASKAAISRILMELRSGAVLDPKMWPKSSQDEALKVEKWAPKGRCRHALPKVMALNCYKQAVPLLPVICWHCHANAVLVAAFRFSLSRWNGPCQLLTGPGFWTIGGARVPEKMGLLNSMLLQTRFLHAFLLKMVRKNFHLGVHTASKNGPW